MDCQLGCSQNLLIANAIALAITQGESDEQVNLISTVFTLVGDGLQLILAERACCKASGPNEASTEISFDKTDPAVDIINPPRQEQDGLS